VIEHKVLSILCIEKIYQLLLLVACFAPYLLLKTNLFSHRRAVAVNSVCRDVDVFGTKTASLHHIL
jgi:hypothetical protein